MNRPQYKDYTYKNDDGDLLIGKDGYEQYLIDLNKYCDELEKSLNCSGENKEVEFTVKCKMNKRWIPSFMKMLHTMESFGRVGHSGYIGIYSDGDGDFRPTFKADVDVDENDTHIIVKEVEGTFYDAG